MRFRESRYNKGRELTRVCRVTSDKSTLSSESSACRGQVWAIIINQPFVTAQQQCVFSLQRPSSRKCGVSVNEVSRVRTRLQTRQSQAQASSRASSSKYGGVRIPGIDTSRWGMDPNPFSQRCPGYDKFPTKVSIPSPHVTTVT